MLKAGYGLVLFPSDKSLSIHFKEQNLVSN
jgi:hypothetical protein